MKTFFLHIWARLRTSFWFVPGLLVAAAAALAYGSLAIGRASSSDLGGILSPLDQASADGIRSLLATAAASVLTLAGVTFSATLVALTLASSQFGSRILRNFIRSLPNQVTLGVLLGNFVLCLIVLRGMNTAEAVPRFAALVAFATTVGSLATFIYFIHHIAVSLQADHIVAEIHEELDETLERYFPEERPADESKDEDERDASNEKRTWEETDEEHALPIPKSGYLQAIDIPGLVAASSLHDLRCRVCYRPGQFVNAGTAILALRRMPGAAAEPNWPTEEEFSRHVLVGPIRTAEQDFEFCMRQLVEIALRALSPGINDPFTAIICIDYLGASLAKVAKRKLPRRIFPDEDKTPRVQVRPTLFSDLLDAAFHQLRQASINHPAVSIRLLETLARIAENSIIDTHREAVLEHATQVAGGTQASTHAECDTAAIAEALQAVRAKCRNG